MGSSAEDDCTSALGFGMGWETVLLGSLGDGAGEMVSLFVVVVAAVEDVC